MDDELNTKETLLNALERLKERNEYLSEKRDRILKGVDADSEK